MWIAAVGRAPNLAMTSGGAVRNDKGGCAMTRCEWEFDNMAFINKTK